MMSKINKLKINKRNIVRILVGLGIGSTLVFSSKNIFNSIVGLANSSIVTNDINLSNDELLLEFQNEFNNSDELQEELGVIYPEVSEFVEEYGQYLDQGQLLNSISTLDLITLPDDAFAEGVLAEYKPKENTIYFNERLKYKKDSQVKEIKEHEFYHYLFFGGFTFSNMSHVGNALDEGISTLLTQESGSFDNTVCYTKNANYVRVICELIGADNFMKACGNHSLSELIDYLSEYTSSSDAQKLIKLIDEACLNYGYIITDADRQAWDIINIMYNNKNGVTIENSNDAVMKIYSNRMVKTSYPIDNAPSLTMVEISKNYFLNTEEEAKIVFKKNGEIYEEMPIENDNNIKIKK